VSREPNTITLDSIYMATGVVTLLIWRGIAHRVIAEVVTDHTSVSLITEVVTVHKLRH
jgi:hypothetical protein